MKISKKSMLPNLTCLTLMAMANNAFAQTAATGASSEGGLASGSMAQILMLVAFGLIFYFMVFRPQSKRMKEHRDLVTKLQTGDEVMTTGGLIGKIARVSDDFFQVTIAEGVNVLVQKQAVTTALPKGTMKSIS